MLSLLQALFTTLERFSLVEQTRAMQHPNLSVTFVAQDCHCGMLQSS